MTDEGGYPHVSASQAGAIFGDRLESDIPLKSIIEEVRDRFEVFLVYLETGAYGAPATARIVDEWKEIFGERFLILKDPADVSELISTTIGLCEGREVDSITKDLVAAGTTPGTIKAVTTALVPYAASAKATGLARATVTGNLPAVAGKGGRAKRV